MRAPAKAVEERCWKRTSDSSVWAEAARGVRRGRRFTSRCSLRGALLESPGLPLRKKLSGSWRRGVGDCTSTSQCMSPVKRRPRGARAEVGEIESIKRGQMEASSAISTLAEAEFTPSVVSATHSLAVQELLISLTKEIREKFEISENNQAKIREACEVLESKINLLTDRLGKLEAVVEDQEERLSVHTKDISQLKFGEKILQDKLESLENNMRRNNIRLLGVPEGLEGEDIKGYVISLIRESIPSLAFLNLEEDIQRVHRDPFRKNPGRKNPRRILINFATYTIKEKILSEAIKAGTFSKGDWSLRVILDVSRAMLDRQWELGNFMQELRSLGATVQLRFPAALRIMWRNKMYNMRDPGEVRTFIEQIKVSQ
ncbi:hypothetical protein NDU88_003066 [Pleurodeles waltl]|uniref:L1 transposable element RRM domain-containing protein n=1 Tax=Pleurodeles waltl TaxID=8319 RepID=A0AAV7M2E4_PLEWA|nr:hypothetical protein NDU88_003066 [Pleurodeles waltl]